MNKSREKGITLVALVVTVIILLILAGVTLNLALGNTGLFKRTQEAANRYKDAWKNESDILNELDKTIEKLEDKKVVDRTGLEIGDTVNYTYDDAENYELLGKNSGYGEYEKTEEGTYKLKTEKDQTIEQVKNAKWQVLSINSDGVIDLVCTDISKNGSQYLGKSGMIDNTKIKEANQNGGVAFGGAIGYTNGVYYLDDICAKQYSNMSLGITSRNIKIEDIDKHLNEAGKKAKKQFIEKIGLQEYIGKNTYYPKLYVYENGSGIDKEELTINGVGPSESKTSSLSIPMNHSEIEEGYAKVDNKLKVDCNYYELQKNQENYFDNNKINEILLGINEGFWIASRYAYGLSDYAVFGLRLANTSKLGLYYLFDSNAGGTGDGLFICPIVSLESNIELIENEDGTWDIKK